MEKLAQTMEELTDKIKAMGLQRFSISCNIEFDDAKTAPKAIALREATEL